MDSALRSIPSLRISTLSRNRSPHIYYIHVCYCDQSGIACSLQFMPVGGPAQVFPPNSFFFGREAYFFQSSKNTQKTDRRRTKRGSFFDTMRISPPHHCNFTIDLQRCWLINRKIGDCQCTYYLIVRALTVAFLLFLL